MKKIAVMFLLLVMVASPAVAMDVDLRWTANLEPDLVGYNVYRAVMSGVTSEAFQKVNQEPVLLPMYTDTVDETKRYVWQVTAIDEEGNESHVSNVVIHPDPKRPIAPIGLKVKEAGP